MQGSLSARRRELILLAYDQFDVDDSGEVNLEDMRAAYDTSHHPEVQGGSKTSDEVLTEFLGGFEGTKKDGTKSSHGGMQSKLCYLLMFDFFTLCVFGTQVW